MNLLGGPILNSVSAVTRCETLEPYFGYDESKIPTTPQNSKDLPRKVSMIYHFIILNTT